MSLTRCRLLCEPLSRQLSTRGRTLTAITSSSSALMSTSASARSSDKKQSHKLVILGGGTGGAAAAHIFGRKLGQENVAVVEPKDIHHYQPMFTLVGGGIRTLKDTERPTRDILPKNCVWIKDKVAKIDPDKCTVETDEGYELKYDYLVCAMGLQLNYHQIKGLPEAFDVDPMLCSNYWDQLVVKTHPAMQRFEEGNVIFTFPNSPIKCAGAPQKIMYLTEEYLRDSGKRDKANVIYNTSLGVIFGVKKYADELLKIAKARNIEVNYRTHLIEVRPETKEAVFENLDTKETTVTPYSMMHVVPPMSVPDVLRESALTGDAGFVTVNKETLQHTVYPNVFGIGDNTDIPTAKTAAAVASQSGALKVNLSAVMDGKPTGQRKYDGYTSCPLVTSKSTCIMAEFDWDLKPLETFPFNQGKERRTMYILKRDILPHVYWRMLTKGLWHGPSIFRKILHLGMGR